MVILKLMQFKQRRGQAFETMMLVISVIVALAILAVLFNILGGVGSLINPSDPVRTISEQLNNIGGQYSRGTAPAEVRFTAGKELDTVEVTQNNPKVTANEVQFIVHESLQDVIEPTGSATNVFSVKRDVQAFIVACSNGQGKYAVAIGRASARTALGELCRQTAEISG